MVVLALVLLIGLLFASIITIIISVGSLILDRRQVKQSIDALAAYDGGVISQLDMEGTHIFQRIPLFMNMLARFGRSLNPVQLTDKLSKQLVYAGMSRGLDKLLASKVVGLVGGLLGSFLLVGLVDSWWLRLVIFLALPIVGFFIPDLWLKLKADARQKSIALSLPGVLDLLAVSVEAGMGFDSALAKVIKNMSGPLSEEFARMLKEIQMGASRKEAFTSLGDRTSVSEFKSFLTSMTQADIFGVSIAETLKIQADTMRLRRQQKAEEIAQKAPVKLVFPTIFCIFPALFVVLLGPAGIRIYNTLIKSALR